ncbi:MAG: hypothetical protein AB7G13_18215 [Lautropia sp.]
MRRPLIPAPFAATLAGAAGAAILGAAALGIAAVGIPVAAQTVSAAAEPAAAAVGRFDARIVTVGAGVVTYRIDTTTGETDACTRAGCISSDRFATTPQAPGTFRLIEAPDRVAVLDTVSGRLYTCDRVEASRDGKAIVTGGGIFNCT